MNSPAHAVEEALRLALERAAFYQYPLTMEELRRRLPRTPAGAGEVAAAAERLAREGLAEERDGFYFPPGRTDLVETRRRRAGKARRLMERARETLETLAGLPWVEGMFLSGANAFDNPADEDVDLFVVCRPGTEWLALLSARLAERGAGVRGLICANYIVASDRLALPERNDFTAFQLVNLRALHGEGLLEALWRENPWVRGHYPNAGAPPSPRPVAAGRPRPYPAWAVRALSFLAEALLRPYLRAARGLRHAPPAVVLEPGRLKLHARDHTEERVPAPPEPAAR